MTAVFLMLSQLHMKFLTS